MNSQRASVLLTVVLIGVILFIMAISLVALVNKESKIITRDENAQLALYIADSGIRYISAKLANHIPEDTPPLYGYDFPDCFRYDEQFNCGVNRQYLGRFTVTAIKIDITGPMPPPLSEPVLSPGEISPPTPLPAPWPNVIGPDGQTYNIAYRIKSIGKVYFGSQLLSQRTVITILWIRPGEYILGPGLSNPGKAYIYKWYEAER